MDKECRQRGVLKSSISNGGLTFGPPLDSKTKGKRKTKQMNKLIKSAMMMASVGAMLCIVGCGGAADQNTPEGVALQQMQSLMAQMGSEGGKCSLKVEKSEINGDAGVVHVAVYDNGKKEHVEKVEVKKMNGNWIAKP